jgi:hypothetical protein
VPPWQLTLDGEPVAPLGPDVLVSPDRVDGFRLVVDGSPIAVPPLDELGIYGGLPEIPDATLQIHYEVTSTPIGTIRVRLALVDGRMVSARAVEAFPDGDEPTVFVSIEWARHLEWRAGECTLLEALEGAHIEARWQTMLLAHGLLQQDEWTAPLRALPAVRPA